ncbi:HupE/UreJ family protein [Salinisphaera sp. P385]|uniref:HupE/UreJ family protein n=1 Tax=Spectribacter acetivorans TaxID=3075603 RepID=A0ABU3B726_9GAMM|nr:HupE/UreJ family protein [Salinisphaera sp. P385]MDT0618044.1 HupE/UreJ family protein [Salinisphaera sp. P385]
MIRGLIVTTLVLAAGAALAHKPSDSYLRLQVDGAAIEGRWDIALRDLHALVGLDGDGNGAITWRELQTRRPAVTEAAMAGLSIRAGEAGCGLRVTEMAVVDHADGTYAALSLSGTCPAPVRELTLDYDFLFELDPTHRGLVNLTFAGTRSAILSPAQPRVVFEPDNAGAVRLFWRYLREGAWHIWAGIDHMLFLVCLLLPAMLTRIDGVWVPVASGRRAFIDILKIVTAFTLAHALSLTAATLDWLRPPTRWVEAGVAATIVFAAVNNLRPLVRLERLWWVAFGFGLIHGAGYASVLGSLGLPAGAMTVALLGFNLGVEGGQILVAALVMPLAFAARRQDWYRHGIVVPGSVIIALLGGLWLVQRLFNLRLEGLW